MAINKPCQLYSCMDNDIYTQVADRLSAADEIAIVSHANPDHDAYGSQVALALALLSLGKRVVVINESGPPERLAQLVGFTHFESEPPEESFDLVVTCDCGDLHRVGNSLISWVSQQKTIINIDHHISNSLFGHFNLVVYQTSSTCEVVFELLKHLDVELTTEIAICLYGGIAGDTGFFKYSSTSERTFHVAGELVAAGVKPENVAEALTGNVPIGALRLQGEVFNSLRLGCNNRYAIGIIDEQLFAKHQVGPEDIEDLVNKIRDIAGVFVAVLIRQEGDLWKVSCRSTEPHYNVSELAAGFGGGGHVMAAAFRWSGPLEQLLEKLDASVLKVFS